jgi:hypothetical protein
VIDGYHRPLHRCASCSAWWSVGPREGDKHGISYCPCGGELRLVDMAVHTAKLPHAAYDRSKDKK